MEPTIHTITLDLQRPQSPGALTVKKGDTHRILRFRLLSGGSPYSLGDDCYGVFTAQKPDGAVLYNHCTREGNTLVYQLTPQTTAVAGRLDCELKLYGPEDALLTTAAFSLTVEDTVYTQGEEAITSTGEATALTRLVSQAKSTLDRLDQLPEGARVPAFIDDTAIGKDAWSSEKIAQTLLPNFSQTDAFVILKNAPVKDRVDIISYFRDEPMTVAPPKLELRMQNNNLFCITDDTPFHWASGSNSLNIYPRKDTSEIMIEGWMGWEENSVEITVRRGLVLPSGKYTLSHNIDGTTLHVMALGEDLSGPVTCGRSTTFQFNTDTFGDTVDILLKVTTTEEDIFEWTYMDDEGNIGPIACRIQITPGQQAYNYAPYGVLETHEADFSKLFYMADRTYAYHWKTGLLQESWDGETLNWYQHDPQTGEILKIQGPIEEYEPQVLREITTPEKGVLIYTHMETGYTNYTEVAGKTGLLETLTDITNAIVALGGNL